MLDSGDFAGLLHDTTANQHGHLHKVLPIVYCALDDEKGLLDSAAEGNPLPALHAVPGRGIPGPCNGRIGGVGGRGVHNTALRQSDL